ncbi:MAG: hypothetical protein GF315_05810 [candidate division Zixibacteria bacterium]|nr:hypothetical protein [candidate division Zixibacteria bacterium]
MKKFVDEKANLLCPKCKKDIEVSYKDILTHKEAICKKCGSGHKFSSSDRSSLRSAVSNYERAQDNFGNAMQKLIKGADVL